MSSGFLTEPTTPLVGIFADDLTGALDAAAPFAERGFRTLVSPTPELPNGGNLAEIVSINLGTRHKSPEEVERVTTEAVIRLAGLGVKVLLNKIDSTLRGNPGLELFHAMKATDADHAVLCSAYPQNGRTVSSGVLLVDQVPVSYTDVGQDQLSPLPSSNVVAILEESLGRAGLKDQVHLIGTEGGAAVSDYLPVIITPDAVSEQEMLNLAERILAADTTAIVSGSAGISVALTEFMSLDRLPRNQVIDEPGTRGRNVLIVTASQRDIVKSQLEVLNENLDIVTGELSLDDALKGVDDNSIHQLSSASGGDGVVVLKLSQLDLGNHADHVNLLDMSATIIRNVGTAVRKLTDASNFDTVVIIGGDTSSGVLEACGVTSLELRGEFQPGTVSGIALDGSLSETLLVTRAGGFGDENSLLELISLLEFGHEV